MFKKLIVFLYKKIIFLYNINIKENKNNINNYLKKHLNKKNIKTL